MDGKPLSIRQVADLVGVHHSYLSRIERGDDVNLKPERLTQLADLLGVDRYFMLAVAGMVPEELRMAIYEHREAFTMFIRYLLREEQEQASVALSDALAGRPWRISYLDEADLLRGLVDAMTRKGWIVSRVARDRMATLLSTCDLPFCDIDLRRGVVATAEVRSLRVFRGCRGGKGGVATVHCSRRIVTGKLGAMVSMLQRMRHAMGARVRVVDGFGMVVFDSQDLDPLPEDAADGVTGGTPDQREGTGGESQRNIVFESLARRLEGTHESRLRYERALGKLVMSAHAFFPWDEMEAFSYIILLQH